ncbi:MAG: RagB/SusD family nutrient uptake outer membrane protein [Chryseolinea sp.]
MKKNFIKFYLGLFAIAGMALSCQDLDEKPEGFVNPGNFYATIAQGEAALTGSMEALWNAWGPGYSYGYGNFIQDDQLLDGDLNIGNGFGGDLWSQHYLAINNINGVLRGIKKGSLAGVDEAELAQLAGQAHYLRAYNYFALVRLFGDLPLITEDTPDPVVTPIKTRTPVADVYALIESDFLFAIDNLPTSWGGEPGKPTKGAAQALLAKAYLTMATAPLNKTENYAKARDMAKALMDAGTYSLVPKVGDVFMPENKFGPENIWSFVSTSDDVTTDPQIWTPEIMDGWGDASIDVLWAENWLDKRPAEPRQDAYLILEYDGTPWEEFTEQRPFIRKYVMPYITDDQYNNLQSTSITPIIRYADVVLIYAEAENMAAGGPTPAAYDALNSIRRRAYDLPLNVANVTVDLALGLSKEAFDKAVIEERDFELCLEYDRWFDIIRKRLLNELATKYHPENIGNVTDDDYLYPIPDFDAKILGSQNPGYTTEN